MWKKESFHSFQFLCSWYPTENQHDATINWNFLTFQISPKWYMWYDDDCENDDCEKNVRWESFSSIGCRQFCVCNDLVKIIQWIIHQHPHQMHLNEKQQIFKMLNSERGKFTRSNPINFTFSRVLWFVYDEICHRTNPLVGHSFQFHSIYHWTLIYELLKAFQIVSRITKTLFSVFIRMFGLLLWITFLQYVVVVTRQVEWNTNEELLLLCWQITNVLLFSKTIHRIFPRYKFVSCFPWKFSNKIHFQIIKIITSQCIGYRWRFSTQL